MKKIFSALALAGLCLVASPAANAQDAETVAQKAVDAMNSAPEAESPAPKPKYWSNSLKTQINIGQTGLVNWAAGGDNTFSLQGFIDGNANWKKKGMFWNNRLQLEMGLLYSSSKPLLQTSNDRIYLESKWGYKTEKMKDVFFSANFDFKSQFAKGWDYKTPSVPDDPKYYNSEGKLMALDELDSRVQRDLWKDARVLKSNFLAPAYVNLAFGIDYNPVKWFSLNFAPITGGYVIVTDRELRQNYGMNYRKGESDETRDALINSEEYKGKSASDQRKALGALYKSARFQFGAQLKMDIKVNVNDIFSYSTQLVLFEDYLKYHKKNPCPRINWDNRIDLKIAKYFSFTIITSLIYDDMVLFSTEAYEKKCGKNSNYNAKWGADGWANKGAGPLVQFKESLAFGFTWTIASKTN